MKLKEIEIKNYRSIKSSGVLSFCDIQALLGENNAGKSNILNCIEIFISSGSGGVEFSDFNNLDEDIIIKGTFNDLNQSEQSIWRSYLVNEQLILEKHIYVGTDEKTGKKSLKNEFHGYRAEPSDWFLSIRKIEDQKGVRPKWMEIVNENHLPDYFVLDGKCNKTIYQEALQRFFSENTITYDEPDLSTTQALGLPSRVVASLPSVYLLHAITDYSNEIDRRTTSTTFRKLMADLSDRILKNDAKYHEVEETLSRLDRLLNSSNTDRLNTLSSIESNFTEMLRKIMPAVDKVRITVQTDNIKEVFSKGVKLLVNDGIETDVLAKGHGLQRCMVFTLLRALILNSRNNLITNVEDEENEHKSIILLIEEPELYLHPQLNKLFFDTLLDFSNTDQVIYTTHSPLYIDAFKYASITIIRKENIELGTQIHNCNIDHFNGLHQVKLLQGLTKFNPSINEMFFAKKVLLVEGIQDLIAVTAVLKQKRYVINRSEELDVTIIPTDSKDNIPFFQRVMNSFSIPYAVLHDTDIIDGMKDEARKSAITINELIKQFSPSDKIHTFPHKLETSLGLTQHFKNHYQAYSYFSRNLASAEAIEIIEKAINSLVYLPDLATQENETINFPFRTAEDTLVVEDDIS